MCPKNISKYFRKILFFFSELRLIKRLPQRYSNRCLKTFFSGYFGIFPMKILLRFSCFQVGEKTFQNILNYILKTSVVCIGIVWCPELIKTCFFFILTIGISDECHPWYFVDIKRGSIVRAAMPCSQLFHWGPILALSVIFIITVVGFKCSLMWWPVYTKGSWINLTIYFTWLFLILYNYFLAAFKGPGFVPLGWEPVSAQWFKFIIQTRNMYNALHYIIV